MSSECLFCGIVAGSVPSVMVAEDDNTYAFMDIDPGSDGHLLVVPRRHSTDLLDIPADDLTATTLAAQWIAKVAVTEFGADGVNLLNCCVRGRMADRIPLPPAPHPAVCRQDQGPADAAVRTRYACGHRRHHRPRPPARRCPDEGPSRKLNLS